MEINIGQYIQKCADDALIRFRESDHGFPPCMADLLLYVFPQTWGNTAGGMGGIGGQAITTQTTVVVEDALNGCAAVYFGRFAYAVNDPGPAFYEALSNRKMPGVWEKRGHLSRSGGSQ
jgi:hypothetical protein